jgi:hypothetical protein
MMPRLVAIDSKELKKPCKSKFEIAATSVSVVTVLTEEANEAGISTILLAFYRGIVSTILNAPSTDNKESLLTKQLGFVNVSSICSGALLIDIRAGFSKVT